MKKLDELYNRINFSTILTTGRTGSDYLQSCLDNVPGILTFSGIVEYYCNFCDVYFKNKKIEEEKPQDVLNLFIEKHISLFTKDYMENKETALDINKFKENFNKICDKETLSRQKFLLAVYLAYHLTLGRDEKNIITMVHHSHSVNETSRFIKDFKNSKLLITIRDPRANLKSGIVNWVAYDSTRENQSHFYIYIKRIREDLKFANKLKNEKLFIKLEEAGELNTKKEISQFLGINFCPEMMKATYAGKIWPGDKLSKFYAKDGEYNKSVINNGWENFFTKKDKIILNFVYRDYKKFGYKIENINWINKLLIIFYIPLPFSFEKKYFNIKNYFKRKNSIKEKTSDIYNYIKRIIYLYLLLLKLY